MASRVLPHSERVDIVSRFFAYEEWKRTLPWEQTDYLEFCEDSLTRAIPKMGERSAKELLLQVILFVHEYDRRHSRMEE